MSCIMCKCSLHFKRAPLLCSALFCSTLLSSPFLSSPLLSSPLLPSLLPSLPGRDKTWPSEMLSNVTTENWAHWIFRQIKTLPGIFAYVIYIIAYSTFENYRTIRKWNSDITVDFGFMIACAKLACKSRERALTDNFKCSFKGDLSQNGGQKRFKGILISLTISWK